MPTEWTLITLLGTLAVGGIVFGLNWLDERKWTRDAARRAEAKWRRSHPAAGERSSRW